jgi:hypothetical protein
VKALAPPQGDVSRKRAPLVAANRSRSAGREITRLSACLKFGDDVLPFWSTKLAGQAPAIRMKISGVLRIFEGA